MTINRQLLIYLGLFVLGLVILFTSFLNQSLNQTTIKLGLATPPPLVAHQAPIEILVPTHGRFVLPRPGLLPTHVFYPLKMIHDRLRLALTFNPEAHAQLLLSLSQTRMSAANQLINLGYTNQAISTAIKGQAYFLQAINHSQFIAPARQAAWYDGLRQAALKDEEIIEKLRLVSQDQSKDQANQLWDQLGYFRSQITGLSRAPFNYPRPEDLPPTCQFCN